jgi:hypothetical protein
MMRLIMKITLIVAIISGCTCHHSVNQEYKASDCYFNIYCFRNGDTFYIFDKEFHISEMRKHFNTNVLVDSSIIKNPVGELVKTYKFYDNQSHVIFRLNSINSANYLIDPLEIKSSIFNPKYSIHDKMSRKDFFKLINAPISNCDTVVLDFIEHCKIIFKNDSIESLSWEILLQ